MELTFVGHQTWLISHGKTNIVLDPILTDRFGHCPEVEFTVYPPRHIDFARLPRIDAVILSHEHFDHLNFPSLDRLSREVPVLVGELMPSAVTRAIAKLGFEVERIPMGVPHRVGDLEVALFRGSSETPFAERRVTQPYFTPAAGSSPAVFIGVDALVSDEFVRRVAAGELPSPEAVVLANNTGIAPRGAAGSFRNLLSTGGDGDARFMGVTLLHALFIECARGLPKVKNVFFCGNGYAPAREGFGPFMCSDHARLAEIANELAMAKRAIGPRPGERFAISETGVEALRADWIELDEPRLGELNARQAAYAARGESLPFEPILGAFASEEETVAAKGRVEAELEPLGRAFAQSAAGLELLALDEYLGGRLGARRAVFQFHGGPGGDILQYAFDFAECRFVLEDAMDPADAVEAYPAGYLVHLKDFVAMLEGELLIWDLFGRAVLSWFFNERDANLVLFVSELYSEQVRPDLASKVYDRAIARLPRPLPRERVEVTRHGLPAPA